MKKQPETDDKKYKTSEILSHAKQAKLKALADLSNKIARGETTAADAKQISQLIQDLEDETKPQGKKTDLIVDRITLAAFFDVSVRQVGNWQQHDPPVPQIRRGWFDLKKVLAWWLENIYVFKGQENDETFMEHRRNREKHNAELARLKVEQIKRNLIPREEIIPSWAARLGEMKSMLLNLENRLSRLLVGMDFFQIKKAIHEEVKGLFQAYAKDTEFTPETEEKRDGEEADDSPNTIT